MKNHKLCYIVEEPSKTKKQELKDNQTSGKYRFLCGVSFTLFSVTFTTYIFLQITQISVVLLLQSLPEQFLHFLGVGAHSATAALLSVCSLLFGVLPVSFSLTLCMNILQFMLELQTCL